MSDKSLEHFCLGIVTFNPPEKIISKIEIALLNGLDVFIYDNSSKDSFFKNLSHYKNFHYFQNKHNVGLGLALRELCMTAHKEKYVGMLYFDQDTNFSKETLDFIENYFYKNKFIFNKVGSFFFNNKTSIHASKRRILIHNNGTLFNLSNLKKINWHDKSYFLDCIDYKYCLDCELAKQEIIEVMNTPGLDHLVDQDGELIPIFGKKFSLCRVYSGQRFIDTLHKGFKIFFTAILNLRFYFGILIARFLIIYIIFQIYARFYTAFKK